jgi:glycosyltransferase involved in cell wall biosynthesis
MSSALMNRTLVLIPAYNEADRIADVVSRVRASVPQADILVANDGSSDRTARIAKEAGALIISHPFNMGYGVTIQTGYKYAVEHGYDFVVQIDGDGQHEPACIPRLLAPLLAGEADFVLGSRFLDGESYEPSFFRRLGMGLFRTLVRWVTGLPITDCTSGFQAFNREVIRFFARDIFPVDYPDADVLITLHRAGFRIRELPVRMYAAEGKSMHSGMKPLYYVFKMTLSIFVTLLRSKHLYVRDS